jgi:hypothetical protein
MGTLGRAIFTVGKWIRGTGQAMDRLGSTIQGGLRVEEQGKHAPSPAPFFSPAPPPPRPHLVAASYSQKGGIGSSCNHFYASRRYMYAIYQFVVFAFQDLLVPDQVESVASALLVVLTLGDVPKV